MNTVEHLAVERLFVKAMFLIVSPCVNNNPLMLISPHVSVLSHSCGLGTNNNKLHVKYKEDELGTNNNKLHVKYIEDELGTNNNKFHVKYIEDELGTNN